MLLDGCTAIVYGAAGPIGSAVASAFVHTLLRRRPTPAEVGAAAAFLASDRAATMTATEVNITGGAVVD